MDKIVEKTLLYDYYGDLLTDRQREIYESVVFNDMSLSEAAEAFGVSRQGIHDLIRRCDGTLASYEAKLRLVQTFRNLSHELAGLREEAERLPDPEKGPILKHLEAMDELLA